MEEKQENAGQSTLRISKIRKELLACYATASVFLYGVISVEEFVDVFNHYEIVKKDREETTLALQRLAKTDDVEYSIFHDIISGPTYQPRFFEYEEDVKSIRQNQKGKPRYLPDRAEFLRYVNPLYIEPKKPYADLKTYILKNRLTKKGEGLDGVDGDIIDLREMIQEGIDIRNCIEYFTENDYVFNGLDDLNRFVQVLSNTYNNTRLYYNNGFTPDEIFERFERPKLKPLPKEPFNIPTIPKVGRNEPCPCGSGLKYKRCHGK